MNRATGSSFVRSFGQLGQERLRLLLLSCHQVLANLPYHVANALLAFQVAQSRTLALS